VPAGSLIGSGDIPTAQGKSSFDSMIIALNKIVFNTQAVAQNTALTNPVLASRRWGTLAGGGWITGGIPNHDSVMLGSGSHLGMPGEFVLRKDVAQANAGWLGGFNRTGRLPFASNDNGSGEIASRLDRLERTLARAILSGNSVAIERSKEENRELRRQTAALERSQRDAATRAGIARKVA
jgi:hypothetical protein